MLKVEFLRILRNPNWKYLLFVLLGSSIYYALTYNNDSSSLSPVFLFPTMHKDLMIGIATMPSFLYAILLYSIAMKEEPITTWYTTLAFPMHQQWHIICKAIALLIFLLPGCLLSILTYIWMAHTISSAFLTYLFSIQIIYFICFFFYCFYVSQGYIFMMGTITSVNVLQRLTPLALGSSIINAGNWVQGFSLLWWKLGILIVLFFIGLLIFSKYTMHTKLYREIVLTKLFQIKPQTMSEITADKYKNRFDTFLQLIFKKLERKKSKTYWETCAVLEVTMKQTFFSSFFILVFLLLFIIFKSFIPLIFMLIFVLNIVYRFMIEKKHIQTVCIK